MQILENNQRLEFPLKTSYALNVIYLVVFLGVLAVLVLADVPLWLRTLAALLSAIGAVLAWRQLQLQRRLRTLVVEGEHLVLEFSYKRIAVVLSGPVLVTAPVIAFSCYAAHLRRRWIWQRMEIVLFRAALSEQHHRLLRTYLAAGKLAHTRQKASV